MNHVNIEEDVAEVAEVAVETSEAVEVIEVVEVKTAISVEAVMAAGAVEVTAEATAAITKTMATTVSSAQATVADHGEPHVEANLPEATQRKPTAIRIIDEARNNVTSKTTRICTRNNYPGVFFSFFALKMLQNYRNNSKKLCLDSSASRFFG